MRRKVDAFNMFELLEHQERISHLPSAGDWEGCVAYYRGLIVRYDAAMLADDGAAAVEARDEAELLRDHIREWREANPRVAEPTNNDSWNWVYSVAGDLEEATAATGGAVPMWGQTGSFQVWFKLIPVRIEMDGLFCVGSFTSLMPHFSINVVNPEIASMFLSETGYRSCFSGVRDAVASMSLDDAVMAYLDAYFTREMKSKLVQFYPREERARRDAERLEAQRAKRAEQDRKREAGLVVEEDAVDEEDEEDDDAGAMMTCECGLNLAQADNYFSLPCGNFCETCAEAHVGVCAECAEDFAMQCDDAEDALETLSAPAPALDLLPGMGNVPAARAEALAEAQGASLTLDLFAVPASISKASGSMEIYSPLFRESAANPQFSLFSEAS